MKRLNQFNKAELIKLVEESLRELKRDLKIVKKYEELWHTTLDENYKLKEEMVKKMTKIKELEETIRKKDLVIVGIVSNPAAWGLKND